MTPGNTNITIENIVINTVSNAVTFSPKAAIYASGGDTGLTIRDVTIYNGAPVNILLANTAGSYDGVVLENITCIGTNSVFVTIPTNPSAVLYFQSCNSLVLNNISLIDQWQELNGMLFSGCHDAIVDGVLITSQLAAPVSTTIAYDISTSTAGIHKNVVVDGGSNAVFSQGISTSTLSFLYHHRQLFCS